jgi:hypothetical protein
MSVLIVEAKVKAEGVSEVQAQADKLFAAIDAAAPDGIRYAWCLRPDGETFVVLVQVDDGVENPIPELREYQETQESLAGMIAERSDAEQLTVIGSYRLFGQAA